MLYGDLTTYATITQPVITQPSLNVGELSQNSPQLHLFLLSTSLIFFPIFLPHCSPLLLPATLLPFIVLHHKDVSNNIACQVSQSSFTTASANPQPTCRKSTDRNGQPSHTLVRSTATRLQWISTVNPDRNVVRAAQTSSYQMIEGHSLDPGLSGSLWIDTPALRYYGDSSEIWAKLTRMPCSQRRYSPLNVGKLQIIKNCK